MAVKLQAKLLEKIKLKEDVYHFKVQAPEIAQIAKPGHFIEIRVSKNTEPFLRRPISIHNMDKEKGILEFIFQVKGEGTKILSERNVGEEIDILGPLGSGIFKYDKYQNIAVIGGGIGVFPLYELCKEAKNDSKNVNTYLGFRSKDFVLLENEFKEISDSLVITTDDGSYANKGFAINYLGAFIVVASLIYIYIAGIISMFVPENHFHFLREIMRILECIVISIISYFFGGIFKKDKRINNEKKNGDF